MAKKTPKIPTPEELIAFLNEQTKQVSKREIARAFGLKGDSTAYLKHVLKEIETQGLIQKQGRHFATKGLLADRLNVEITGQDANGSYIGRPVHWKEPEAEPQIILKKSTIRPALKIGDIVLCKVHALNRHLYEAEALRRVQEAESKMVGVLFDGRIMSVDRRFKEAFFMDSSFPKDLNSGDVVLITRPESEKGLAHFVEKIGKSTDSNIASLISIFAHSLPVFFTKEALSIAKKAKVPPLDNRTDLRSVPLVTIDGKDARDFDDAVFAEPDTDEHNKNGWHIYVAIADVAWYVHFGSSLDKDAFLRGNSTYFPDRVLPMLPEDLSNGVCSLNPKQDRAAMVCELWIDKNGHKLKHHFFRALIRSAARLTYDEVEADFKGKTKISGLGNLIDSLKGAYQSLLKARLARGVLEIDVPEMQVELDNKGKVLSIHPRERFESHKMIEELMILANVAAAETLEKLKMPTMYRVHDRPSEEKLENLRNFLKMMGLSFKADNPTPENFNEILEKARKKAGGKTADEFILRTQAQAEYSPENIGHFGLSLEKYAHFTSPIRRYADIMVHRALISGLKLGEGGLSEKEADAFQEIAEHISATERQSASAEQDALDRYVASFLEKRTGAVFDVRISSVTRFGLFVSLDEYGADGLVPFNTLGNDYFQFDEEKGILRGERTHQTFVCGQHFNAVLKEAVPLTGGLLFTPVSSKNQSRGNQRRQKNKHPSRAPKQRRTVRGRRS